MEALATGKYCETCGSFAGADMLSGFCPSCLLNTVLETESDSSANGSRIEDYELLNEIARGGMGIVYRARQRTPSRIVALKMILPAHLGSPGALDRFRTEAEAAASLDQEGILPIYAVGDHDGAPFYSMKFAEGGALSARLNRYREQPAEAATLIAKLSRAVASAHDHGILHRDLKPANVLFDAADKPYVADFGLAKWVERECDLTQTLGILGTPFYMAPEQAANSRGVTAAADVYSLGAILYHLLAGHPPVSGDTPMEVLRRSAEEKPKRPRLANPHVSRDLETICLKCLEKEPALRYASAGALADDLDRFCAYRTIQARPTGLTRRTWRWTRRNPGLAGLTAITLALLLLLAVVFPAHRNGFKTPPLAKSVAALPFETLGAQETGELLATGLHNDVLVSLSKIADLKVISRSSVLRYRATNADPRQIGRELGVDAVLVGTLRQDGNHARITVQLIKVADGSQIWAENFDRELNDVFTIENDLALQIASVLKATVLPMEANGIRRRPTNDPQAYLLYVQAQDLFADSEKPRTKLEKAEQLLQQAVERDPHFALALALLSQTKTVFGDMYEASPARLDEAKNLAEQALRLEPDLPEAHMAMGYFLWQGQAHIGEMDLAGGAREFETALRSLPGSAELHTQLGRLQRQQGKWPEALANVEKGAALDPNTPLRWEAVYATSLYMRRYPAALQAVERAIALNPNSWRCEWLRGLVFRQWKGDLGPLAHLRPQQQENDREIYVQHWFNLLLNLHRFDEAEEIVRSDSREMMPSGSGPVPKSALLGYLYAAKKNQEKAREYFEEALPIMERTVTESPLDAERHRDLADVYAQLGRKEDAIREGKRACELLPETKDALNGVAILTGIALLYLEVGEEELALPILEHSLSTPGGAHVGYLRTSVTWEPFWNNPRLRQLLAKYEPRE